MGEKPRTAGYHRRIQRALREGPRPMSVRQLGEAVEAMPDRPARGATYGGIRQYATGGVKRPRLDVLQAIASVLGVRWQWLAHEDGPMTADAEIAEYVSPSLKRWFAEGGSTSFITRYGDLPDAALSAAWTVLSQRYTADQLTDAVDVEGVQVLRGLALHRQLADAALAPLDVLGLTPEEVTPELEDYIATVALALRQYLRDTRKEG